MKRRALLSALVPALAGLAVTVTGAAAAPADAAGGDTWPVPPSATVTITGHGYGHGHGLSQYGARGAARQGLSWKQIVGFYYPGTKIARTGGQMRVLITADTSKDVMVDAQRSLRLRRLGDGKGPKSMVLAKIRPHATRWRINPLGADGAKSRIDYRLQGKPGWHRLTSFTGAAEFAAGRQPITLRLPGRASASYRGTLRSVDKATVDVVPMEDYVRGVVPYEMPATWEQQALRSQAVAARTYAAFERSEATGDYDICDSEACQVYGGVASEQPGSDQAVRRTAHKIVSYSGVPAFTQFSSSNGGWTSAGSQPYLVAQPDPYEASSDNPYATWSVDFTDTELEQAFPKVGDLTSISFTDRDGHGDWGGRVGDVVLTGSTGSVAVSGDDFRSALDLRSTYLTVSQATAR